MIRLLVRHLLIQLLFVNTFHLTFAQSTKIDSVRSVLKKLPADTNRVNTLIYLCRIQSSASTEQMALTAQEALSLARKIHFGKGEANANIYLALYYNKAGNAPKAIEFLLKALRYYEGIQNIGYSATCYNNIGVIYRDQGELDEALDYFKKAHAVWHKLNSKGGMVRSLYNIAAVYVKQKRDSLALDYYTRSLKICEEIPDRRFTSQILNSVGMIHLRRQNYETSMVFQERALQLAVETEDEVLQAQSYGAMSEIYAAQNQHDKALTVAKVGLEHALKITSKIDLLDSYNRVYKAYERLNDYRKAFEFQSLYLALSDSLKSSENVAAMAKLKSRYELDKKESEIKLLTQRHLAESSRRNLFIAVLSGLLIIGFLLYNRYRLITQRKLAFKKQQLAFYTQSLIERSETINRINMELERLKSSISNENIQITKIDKILQSNILTDGDWETFKKSFEEIYPAFFAKLRHKYPAITVSEQRLSALIKLNLSTKEIASMLGISPDSVKTSRYRFKRKLGLTENETVEEFIKKLEIPDSNRKHG